MSKITLPCGHKIEPDELKSVWGSYQASKRVNRTPGTGRPRTLARCNCGKYAVNRKPKSHEC